MLWINPFSCHIMNQLYRWMRHLCWTSRSTKTKATVLSIFTQNTWKLAMRTAEGSRSNSQIRLLWNILEIYCIDSMSRIVSLLRRSCLSVFTMKRVATDNKSTTCCMQMTWKVPDPTSHTWIACFLCSRFKKALNVDCVSCTRAARVGTLPRTFRLPLQSVFRYTRAHRPEGFRTVCFEFSAVLVTVPGGFEWVSGGSTEITWQYWSLARRRRPRRRREHARSLPLCGGTRDGKEVKEKKRTSVVTMTPHYRQGETLRR